MNLLKLDMIEELPHWPLPAAAFCRRKRLTDGFIGVRPEHVRVGQERPAGRVSATDYLGAETVAAHGPWRQTLFGKIDGHHRL
jgi:hypothetical protein